MNKSEIFVKIKKGDQKAFKIIFDQFYRYMTTVSWRIVADSNTAEDITQEAFVELWNRKELLPDDLMIKSYLRKIVINKSLNFIKKKKNKTWDNTPLENSYVDESHDFQQIDYLSMQETITKTVDNLPNKCRIIFSLSRFEELSHKEIAKKLNISTKTIESQITIALKRIRKALKENGFISILLTTFISLGKILNIF